MNYSDKLTQQYNAYGIRAQSTRAQERFKNTSSLEGALTETEEP